MRLEKNLVTHQKVAMKAVRKKDLKVIEMFQMRREIDILKMCQHPGMSRLIDVFEDATHFYVAMEHIGGKNLYDYLKTRSFRLSETRCREILAHLSKAVQYLHRFGILHRDIKLENVMMSDQTDFAIPKIIDFGLARVVGPGMTSDEPFGTLGYVSPEVLKKEAYNFSCDIWSLGCITYALLSGSLPFDHKSPVETVKMTLRDPLQFELPIWRETT